MDSYWISYYLFPALHLGIKYKQEDGDRLNLWAEVSKSCGWWWSYENICIVSDRPKSVHFDEQWQLHNESGPALLFRDSYSVYANHNVRHEGWFIEHPEQLSVEKIEAEDNAEIRRIMIEKFGYARYLSDTGAKEIHQDQIPIGGGVDGVMMRSLIRDKRGMQFLCGHDGSTERIYFMPVDPDVKTCADAHFSICGFREDQIVANA